MILADGFRSLRMTALTQQLNTSFATLYQIAPSKDELVTLAFERWYDGMVREAVLLVGKAKTPMAQLESWTASTIHGISHMSRKFLNDVGTHTGVRGVLNTYVHYWIEVLHVILDAGIAQKQFRPINTDLLAVVWEASTMNLADRELLAANPQSPRQIAEDWIDIVLNGILRK
jgi:AcrR family transcriptional regulator